MDKIKESPILFSSEMVRAILDDRKTETRRVIRVDKFGKELRAFLEFGNFKEYDDYIRCPYGKPGDILYVRETFFAHIGWIDYKTGNKGVCYKADIDGDNLYQPDTKKRWYTWKPSIHMPKKFSRIKLGINEIRVERVRDITDLSAINEGALRVKTDLVRPGYSELAYIAKFKDEKPPLGPGPIERFRYLWDSLNKKRGFGWDKNPWVWVIKFEKINHYE